MNDAGWGPVKLTQEGTTSYESYGYYHALYSCSFYGPTFGGSHDLYIADYASTNTDSYSSLGNSYGPPSGYSVDYSFSQSFLTGSHKFTPDEVEVFY